MNTDKARPALALILLWAMVFQLTAFGQRTASASADYQVYFSPRGGATSAIVRAIEDAKSSILVQAYSFTSEPIARAMVDAHGRGVKVQVLLDKSNRHLGYSCANRLSEAGVPTLVDAAHAIAHNKVMIIDNEIVITGSFNFSRAAEERNAENLLVIHNRELAARYRLNWYFHEKHSKAWLKDGSHYDPHR